MLLTGVNLKREDKQKTDRADVERLVQSVGSLPLAIDQAASYIRESKSELREVLEIYQSDEISEVSEGNGKESGVVTG